MQNKRFSARLFLILLFAAAGLCFSAAVIKHPYYISMTEIRIDTNKKTVNTSCRMFTDDLQQALFKLYGKRVDLQKQDTTALPLLRRYISERLQISIGGQLTKFKLIGYEIEEEATWCYLETTPYTQPGKVQITSKLLYDFLPEQTNFIHCYRNTERKSTKLVNPETQASFEF
ncbi:MAG: DUF6702 family protein [Bacteroidota bacterium]|jgi:hypothetical protein